MYQVIKEFHDLQDVTETKSGLIYHKYSVGDTYPRQGLNPSEGRVAELAGPDNAQGQPLIQAVTGGAGQPSEPDNEEQATEAAPVAEPPKKRKPGKQAAPAED